jgi:hypothetical protein
LVSATADGAGGVLLAAIVGVVLLDRRRRAGPRASSGAARSGAEKSAIVPDPVRSERRPLTPLLTVK